VDAGKDVVNGFVVDGCVGVKGDGNVLDSTVLGGIGSVLVLDPEAGPDGTTDNFHHGVRKHGHFVVDGRLDGRRDEGEHPDKAAKEVKHGSSHIDPRGPVLELVADLDFARLVEPDQAPIHGDVPSVRVESGKHEEPKPGDAGKGVLVPVGLPVRVKGTQGDGRSGHGVLACVPKMGPGVARVVVPPEALEKPPEQREGGEDREGVLAVGLLAAGVVIAPPVARHVKAGQVLGVVHDLDQRGHVIANQVVGEGDCEKPAWSGRSVP